MGHIEHLNQIPGLSDPQTSPDGKSIVVVAERSDPETNRWTGELVLLDTLSHFIAPSGQLFA